MRNRFGLAWWTILATTSFASAGMDVAIHVDEAGFAQQVDGRAEAGDGAIPLPLVAQASVAVTVDNNNDRIVDSITIRGLVQGLTDTDAASASANITSEQDTMVYSRLRTYAQPNDPGTLTNVGERFFWEGAVKTPGVIGFATFLWQEPFETEGSDYTGQQQIIAGTFSNSIAAYSFKTLLDGRIVIEAMPWEYALESEQDISTQDIANPHLTEIPEYKALVKAKEKAIASASASSSFDETLARSNPRDIRDVLSETPQGRRSLFLLEALGVLGGWFLGQTAQIDVVFVITNRAMCEFANQTIGCSAEEFGNTIEDQLKISIAQANTALEVSKVNALYRIVGYHHDTTGYDVGVSDEALWNLANPFDGKLDYVGQLKRNKGADLVSLISHVSGGPLGIAFPGPFSVNGYTQLSSYTVAHELGHNLFCDHNPEDSNFDGFQWIFWWYGWQVPGEFHTIMAYPCRDTNCRTRIPFFSTADQSLTYNGFPLGNQNHNNAGQMRIFAPIVAAFQRPCPCNQGWGWFRWLCELFFWCCSDC